MRKDITEENAYTSCGICNASCGMKVKISGGRIIGVQGDKEHLASHGYLCRKGRSVLELINSPERLRFPLRKNQDQQWERISWEDALEIIADKITRIKEKHGPEALAVHVGQAGVKKQYTAYAEIFARLFGTPNFSTAGSHCHLSRAMASVYTFGAHPEPDFANSKCIVLWGSNPNISDPTSMNSINHSLKNGAKLIVVDPRLTTLAKKADLYLQVRPGTDGALALAIINRIIEKELYDRNFVQEWTVGFEKLQEAVKDFTPEKAAAITGVPAERIIQAAELYARSTPACISEGNALELHTNGFQTSRAISILQAICGNLDIKGGALFVPPLLAPLEMEYGPCTAPAVGQEEYQLFYNFTGNAQANILSDAILSGKPYEIKGLILDGSNPLLTWPNANKVKNALMKLDFFVIIEHFMTESARLADLLLPAGTMLGRYDLWEDIDSRGRLIAGLSTPLIDENECLSNWWIWKALADKMGYAEYYPWKDEAEALDDRLRRKSLSLELLQNHPHGYIYGQWTAQKYLTNGFATPSGKAELYSDKLREFGYPPIPTYYPTAESHEADPEIAREYPLILSSGARTREYLHSRFHNLESLKKRNPEPWLELNPDKASQLRISEGEMVKIESKRGEIDIKVRLNPSIEPEIVLMPHGWPQANANLLTDNVLLDPVTGFPPYRSVQVRISKL